MKEPSLTVGNFDRLAKAVMERHRVSYSSARSILAELRLGLVADASIGTSIAQQAALLTAVNTGIRAFRGGVMVSIPDDVPLLVIWPGAKTLNTAVRALGATICDATVAGSVLVFGNAHASQSAIRVVSDGWRGGIFPAAADVNFVPDHDFALGGVLAAGIAVAHQFVRAAAISNRDLFAPYGFSLWKPDVSWLSETAKGPKFETLPAKLWLLGLGHLGQAYSWTLGLLRRANTEAVLVYLQDYDDAVSANWSAGLLSDATNVGRLKTRIVSDWLESRGFCTRLVERAFDEHTRCQEDEPRIALCGFDNSESRRLLECGGFDLIVDAALGGNVERFDRIVIRTFPDATHTADEIFRSPPRRDETGLTPQLLEIEEEECGILFDDLSGRAVSSSFVGATASTFVIAEVLRALHGGSRCEFLNVHLRDLGDAAVAIKNEDYILRVARNGFVALGTQS